MREDGAAVARATAKDAVAEAVTASGSGAELSEVIGRQLRSFRQAEGLSLRALAARSGLSIGFLSQLERGLTSIGLTTLRDLAETLDRDITEFFDASGPAAAASEGLSPERYFTLTRASGEHTSQYLSGGRTYRMLSKRAAGLALEPMLVQIAPGGELGELEVHAGEEFAYVIEGELVYVVDGEQHRLRAGDSLHLKSEIPHCLHNDTDQVTVVVSVVTPRLF